jgi:SSS family solute:Na+ symporter
VVTGSSQAVASRRRAVGGRNFGTLLFWFMNAGEVYTTFAVLGISGYAWALGAPAYLAFTSVSLSYAIGYWLMPKIWQAGRRHNLITQADFFAMHYRAPCSRANPMRDRYFGSHPARG